MNTEQGKKAHLVHGMFGNIAPIYDRLNSIISLGLHKRWKQRTVQLCHLSEGDTALDLCTGTGDLALMLEKAVGKTGNVVGADFCQAMLDLAKEKIKGHNRIQLVVGDAMNLPFKDNSFDGATVAFGLRNVEDIPTALREMARVVKPGGRVVSLDLARPKNEPFKTLYHFYFFRLVPFLGSFFGSKEAYYYLPNSLLTFPDREPFAQMMRDAGMEAIQIEDQFLGVVAIHAGTVKGN